MTTLLLIRHAQTDWNAQHRWQGQTDMPLNALGRRQAAALGTRLAKWPLAAVYSSDLQRAADTAAAIVEHHGLPVQIDPVWRERHAGNFEGLTHDDIERHYPQQWAEMQQGFIRPIGGETSEMLQARALLGFERLLAAHPDGETVAVVSHGGTLAAVLAHVLNLPLREARRISLGGNTGISRVQREGQMLRLTLLNDTAHLESLAP